MWKTIRRTGITGLELVLDLILLTLFCAQAFVAGSLLIYGYIPIPSSWANEILLTHKSNGFYVQAESFRLKLDGEFRLLQLQVFADNIREPILEAETTTIEYQLNKDKQTPIQLTGVVISHGTLHMPAIHAPDGTRTEILRNIALRLTPSKDKIQIDSFAGLHEDINLRGTIDWPLPPSTKAAEDEMDTAAALTRFYQLTALALKEKERFSPFIEPTLEFALRSEPDQSVHVTATLSCDELRYSEATGNSFKLDAAFQIKDGTLSADSPLQLSANAINIPKFKVSANTIKGYIAEDQWTDLLNGAWPEFKIAADQLIVNNITLNSTLANIDPTAFPELSFTGATNSLNGAVAFSGKMNSTDHSGHFNANGSVDLFSLIPSNVLEIMPKLQFASSPDYSLSIYLNPNFELDSANFKINSHDVTANGLHFDHVQADGSWHNGLFSLNEIQIDRGRQWIDATFSFDTNNKDYKIALLGSAFPDQYSPLLPSWWPTIFEDVTFADTTRGYGDFIIYGNTSPGSTGYFIGHATANDVSYKGAHIDQGELIVRGRGNYVELHNIDATTGGGWAKGNVGFVSSRIPEVKGLTSVRYDFESLMPLDVAKKIFGGTIESIIDDFEVTQLPRISLHGVNYNDDSKYKGQDNFYLDASIQAPVTFKKVPLEHLKFILNSRGNITFLRDVAYGYAGGEGTAMIDIMTPPDVPSQIRLKLDLLGADQEQAVQNLPNLDTIEAHWEQSPAIEAEKKKIRSTGELDLRIHAQGPTDSLYQYTGHGDFVIDNEQLGAIQLLGPLSKLLQNTRLNFTSFNLNKMEANFEIANNRLLVEELVINGPLTRIIADGTFLIESQDLDMRVSVNLLENMGSSDSPLQAARKFILSPLPNLLTFDLTGTVTDQKLRLVYDPRNLIPGL